MREQILESYQKIHDSTAIDVKLRWNYEDAIKRPYFHVKPLEKSQLSAWRNYLEFEIKEGNEKRIKVLFERCLIACAFYEEFWMRVSLVALFLGKVCICVIFFMPTLLKNFLSGFLDWCPPILLFVVCTDYGYISFTISLFGIPVLTNMLFQYSFIK